MKSKWRKHSEVVRAEVAVEVLQKRETGADGYNKNRVHEKHITRREQGSFENNQNIFQNSQPVNDFGKEMEKIFPKTDRLIM